VLRDLVDRGFVCEHGGTYDDPATGKPREFDIRATKRFGKRFVRLAVECKNLGDHFPLLVSCLPRRRDEAFQELIYSFNPENSPSDPPGDTVMFGITPSSRLVRLPPSHSRYRPQEPVGKSCNQVGRSSNGDITGGDSGIYQKWAQALSSAEDLVHLACSERPRQNGKRRSLANLLSCSRAKWQTLANGFRFTWKTKQRPTYCESLFVLRWKEILSLCL
jgi:hypothetical protein